MPVIDFVSYRDTGVINLAAEPYPSEKLVGALLDNQLAAKRARNRQAVMIVCACLAAVLLGLMIGAMAAHVANGWSL